jgi:hypothetical protein
MELHGWGVDLTKISAAIFGGFDEAEVEIKKREARHRRRKERATQDARRRLK